MADLSHYLICSDYDGTFSDRGEVSPADAEAVRAFQRDGGHFTIASGRSPDFLWTKRESFIPNAPIISINGTMINDPGDMSVLKEYTLDDEAEEAVRWIWANTPTQVIALHGADREGHWFKRPGLEVPFPHPLESADIDAIIASVPRPWYKVIFVQSAETTPTVMRLCLEKWGGRYEFDRSWPMGLELHQKGSGKGACLSFIREWMGDPDLTIIGAGDYENDISLVRDADIGYAMGNATDEVKAAADRVTVRNTENAIAAIIRDIREMAERGDRR